MSLEGSEEIKDERGSSAPIMERNEKTEENQEQGMETENANTSAESNTVDDPYAYLNRNDFTSEKYKIEIWGLPKHYGISQLRKLLNEKLHLGCNKVKSLKPGSYWAYVCFRNEEDRIQALTVLNGYKWKGNELKAKVAKPCPDPLVKKRKGQTQGGTSGPESKQPRTHLPIAQRIKDSAEPFWNLPYKEQLIQKGKAVRAVLLHWSQQIQKLNPELKAWLNLQRDQNQGLPCVLRDVRPSPKKAEYRNKCEFTIGINEETGKPTVGFRVGSYMDGSAGVGPVDNLEIIPTRMKEAAKVFEQFVCESSLKVFCPETYGGSWRQLMARLSMSGALMLAVGIHPQDLSSEQLGALSQELENFFSTGAGAVCKVDALYLELLPVRASADNSHTLQHICGETNIYETVCDLSFRISPEAFFQVNTGAAEVLYNTIAEMAKLTPKTSLLDVCCGTGTIGLCLAKHCGQVIGVELSKQAVDDAKANAARNNITNCEFFAGGAEDLLSAIIQRAVHEHIVAVVNPPRAGLHQKAMTVLRNAKNLNHLVYVSCDPKAAFNNFVLLTRAESKTYHRPPFVPVCAVPVDMFPNTPHCEVVIYMERFDKQKFSQSIQSKSDTTDVNEQDKSTKSSELTEENCDSMANAKSEETNVSKSDKEDNIV